MNRKVSVIALAVMAVAMLATPLIGTVYATKSIPVEFTSTGYAWSTLYEKQAGKSDTLIRIERDKLLWDGDFEGDCVMEVHLIFHNYGTPYETYIYQETVTFTGTVLGEYEGTLTVVGGQGNWRIISGTGELANLRGQGKMGPSGTPNVWSFTGQVHFDP